MRISSQRQAAVTAAMPASLSAVVADYEWPRLRWLAPYLPVPAVLRCACVADLVVTHGDFALENIVMQQRLLLQYGMIDADQGKLQWHLLLDELF